jgi:hypothetical protein
MQAWTTALGLEGCQVVAVNGYGSFTAAFTVPPPYILLASSLQCNQQQSPCPGSYTPTTVFVPARSPGVTANGLATNVPVTVALFPSKKPVAAQRTPSLLLSLNWQVSPSATSSGQFTTPFIAPTLPPELHVSFGGCNSYRGNECKNMEAFEFFTNSAGLTGSSLVTMAPVLSTKYIVWLLYVCCDIRHATHSSALCRVERGSHAIVSRFGTRPTWHKHRVASIVWMAVPCAGIEHCMQCNQSLS